MPLYVRMEFTILGTGIALIALWSGFIIKLQEFIVDNSPKDFDELEKTYYQNVLTPKYTRIVSSQIDRQQLDDIKKSTDLIYEVYELRDFISEYRVRMVQVVIVAILGLLWIALEPNNTWAQLGVIVILVICFVHAWQYIGLCKELRKKYSEIIKIS